MDVEIWKYFLKLQLQNVTTTFVLYNKLFFYFIDICKKIDLHFSNSVFKKNLKKYHKEKNKTKIKYIFL